VAGNKSSTAARAQLEAALGRVAAGERTALREVYELTSAKLFGVCLRICSERDAAEDVLQEVYLKVWRSAGRFDASRASPITWLCTIARNSAIDWRRSVAPPAHAGLETAQAVADESPDATAVIEDREQRAKIFECLDGLDERQGRAIRTAFFDGLSYGEIADVMRVPLGTMKSWIRRGLIQLRGCLDG
jgi:RNA polymerase sigma-70 factor (ECF subfamily)